MSSSTYVQLGQSHSCAHLVFSYHFHFIPLSISLQRVFLCAYLGYVLPVTAAWVVADKLMCDHRFIRFYDLTGGTDVRCCAGCLHTGACSLPSSTRLNRLEHVRTRTGESRFVLQVLVFWRAFDLHSVVELDIVDNSEPCCGTGEILRVYSRCFTSIMQ